MLTSFLSSNLIFSFIHLLTYMGVWSSWSGFWVLNTMYCVPKMQLLLLKCLLGILSFIVFTLNCAYYLLRITLFLHTQLFSHRIYLDITITLKSYTCIHFSSFLRSFLTSNYLHHRKQGLLRLGESYLGNLIWLIIAPSLSWNGIMLL